MTRNNSFVRLLFPVEWLEATHHLFSLTRGLRWSLRFLEENLGYHSLLFTKERVRNSVVFAFGKYQKEINGSIAHCNTQLFYELVTTLQESKHSAGFGPIVPKMDEF